MSTLLSGDKRISGDTQRAKVVSRRKQHRDLDLSLKIHPIRKDIIPLKDDAAVKNAIKTLLQTNAFERPFQPGLGANLRGLLFEPADAITKIAIKENIKDVITRHEPRAEVLSVEVKDDADSNAYNILVRFLLKEIETEQSVEIILRRLR